MIRPTLMDLNPVELDYSPLMIIWNSVDDLYTKICMPSKTISSNMQIQ